MKYFSKSQIHELLIYVVIWFVVLMAPLVDSYSKFSSGLFTEWQWDGALKVWLGILPFFILFLVHELWLIPYFLIKKRYIIYILLSILCLGMFSFSHELVRPLRFNDMPSADFIKGKVPSAHPTDGVFYDNMPDEDAISRMHPYDEAFDSARQIERVNEHKHWNEVKEFGRKHNKFKERLLPFPPYLLTMTLAILLLGLNLGIKFLFKSMRDEERLKELEKQNLEDKLEYLKYQINPHFFMNTLNNIHALIDIDTDKAKSTIIELSKLMRYVLYESSHGNILLEKEIEFLNHYITLMRLRYNNKVKIDVDFPHDVGKIEVPPLLFVSFIENAFKHGISYQFESFIRISLKIEDNEIFFSCVNSKHATNQDTSSGIGLENVKKRLHLLFGNDYLLNIDDKDDTFDVLLVIPVTI